MDPKKAQFKRLIELMGWSQTEAARRLYITPSAINHLVNPDHPNRPTKTIMQLFKHIIASKRPDLINAHTFEFKKAPAATVPGTLRLSSKECDMINSMRQLPLGERAEVYVVISALLRAIGRK
jgi:hypothetical protein